MHNRATVSEQFVRDFRPPPPRPCCPRASVHSVLSLTPKMNEVTSLGISGTAIAIANNEEAQERKDKKRRVSLINQLFMVGRKEGGRRIFMMDCDKTSHSSDLI